MSETGRLISVSKTTLGSVLAAAATAGDGTVSVQDTTDFGEQSGTLQLGGTQNDYTAADPATGIITLAGTLAANADEGDRVDVWDTGLGQVAEEVRALVALPGRLGGDEPITAYIGHALAAFVDEGLRDPGTEEAVTMVQDGDSWLVTDVRGKNARATSPVVTGEIFPGDPSSVSISRTNTGPGGSSATGGWGVAVGVAASAPGSGAVAVGVQSTGAGAVANGSNAIAIGGNARVDGDTPAYAGPAASIAIGNDAAALGYGYHLPGIYDSGNTAVGNQSRAGVETGGVAGATAVGDGATATETGATALGASARAIGGASVSIGQASTGAEVNGVAVGAGASAGTTSGDDYATAVGAGANAQSANSLALGKAANTQAAGAVAIGTDNTGAGATSATVNGIEIGTALHKLGFMGATPVAKAATPTTLADVITILQALGLCN